MYFLELTDMLNSKIFDDSNNSAEYYIMVGQDSRHDVAKMINELNDMNIKFFGGVYYKLIANGKTNTKGFIINKFYPVYSEIVHPFIMKNIPELKPNKEYTGIIIGNANSEKHTDLIDTINLKTKGNINYIGGGCSAVDIRYGEFNVVNDPLVFNNEGLFKDSFHLCIVENKTQTELKFGWKLLEVPFTVNKMDGNVLMELDNDNPFELYQYRLQEIANIHLNKSDLDYLSIYPFAVVENGEITNIRTPFGITEDGYISFGRSINVGDQLFIITADKQGLLEASNSISLGSLTDQEKTFVFSCGSREIALENEFITEIKSIDSKSMYKAEGALVGGEYSNNNKDKKIIVYEGACIVSRMKV